MMYQLDTVRGLHIAAEEGDLELVRRYVSEGVDLEAVGTHEYQRAVLGIAAHKGHTEIVRFLVAQGANPNGPPQSAHGPLKDAVESGKADVVQILLQQGADPNAVDAKGWNAILAVAFYCDIDPEKEWSSILQQLIIAGCEIDPIDMHGRTALHVVLEHDPPHDSALEVVRILIEAGAEVDARHGDNGWTPLMGAVEVGNLDAARLLVKAGADVNIANEEGDTAWNMALRWGYPEIAALLEQAGAVAPAGVETDLHQAVLWGKAEAVEHLLEQGIDANSRNKYHQSALRVAIEAWGKAEIVRLLLDHGADVNAADETDILLTAAVESYRPKVDRHAILRLLIEHGADIPALQRDGSTVLQLAAQGADKEIVRILLEAGADVNAGDWEGRTALMEAAHYGKGGNVALLLEYGANVNLRTLTLPDSGYYGGSTALIHAVKSQHLDIARLLLEHGADVNASDDAGYTSLLWLICGCFGSDESEGWENSLGIVRLLLEWGADVNRQDIHKHTALDVALYGMWGPSPEDKDEDVEWSEVALLLQQAGAIRGEPRPQWCYMAVPCEGFADPSEDEEIFKDASV